MSSAVDTPHRNRLALDLIKAHVRVLDCQERVRQAYPDVFDANAALSAARVHLVEVQHRFDRFWTYP